MPYSIDSDADNYPLVKPWRNYFEPPKNIFDTGSPENPYPSIMGIHNGIIKPNQTITYPNFALILAQALADIPNTSEFITNREQ